MKNQPLLGAPLCGPEQGFGEWKGGALAAQSGCGFWWWLHLLDGVTGQFQGSESCPFMGKAFLSHKEKGNDQHGEGRLARTPEEALALGSVSS